MIVLLSEKKMKSDEYLRIRYDFHLLWDILFWNKEKIDQALLKKFGIRWLWGRTITRSRLKNLKFSSKIIPKGFPLSSEEILQGNLLPLARNWEYPWAVLNSRISVDTKILDVGSGTSLFPLYLAGKSNHIDSLDVNEYQMKVIAPVLAEILKVKVNYFLGDALHLTADDNTYDYVFCLSVLEHLEQEMVNGILVNKHPNKLDRLAIKEYLRVIKPGGKIILTLDYGNENLCTDWIKCSFEFEYIKELIEDFSANLLVPLKSLDEIKLTTEKEREVIKLWSEFYPPVSQEKPRFGTALGIILTK
jgi:SAM-dependent methyltransferase